MKVKVNVKASPKVQEKYYEQVIAEAYAEMEVMFQENKDLRVAEAHLRDDLACAQAQIEAQRQAILHRDEQMLDQFEEIEALQRAAEENEERKDEITELRDENCNLLLKLESAEKVIESLETQLTRTELHNTALESRLEEVLSKFAELQIEFNELNEDYDELAKAKREYAEEIDRLRNENNGLRHQMPLPEFMRQFIEMTREAVKNEFPDSGNS